MTNAPLSWTVERAGNLLEQEVVWSCGLCGGSDLQVARATEGRGLMGGPGRFWEPPGLRLAELGWDARRAWWAWCVRPPRGHFTCSAAPHLEGICPQGTLGDGWGHLWLSHLGGGPWHRGAGGQGGCSTPRRAQEGPPQRMIWPQMPLVSRLRSHLRNPVMMQFKML